MKLWPSRQGFLRNSLRLKLYPSVAFAHAQMTYFETQSDFTDQILTFKVDFLVFQVKEIL